MGRPLNGRDDTFRRLRVAFRVGDVVAREQFAFRREAV
jgi:hypothetical protein